MKGTIKKSVRLHRDTRSPLAEFKLSRVGQGCIRTIDI